MDAQSTASNRSDLAKFIKDPRTLRAFEDLSSNQDTLVTNVNAVIGAPVVGITTSDIFTEDRALAGSGDILLTDGGAKGHLTVSLTPTGVMPGVYGSQTQLSAFQVDSKGRISLAARYTLITDNVMEGVANLFFTEDRARASIVDGAGVDYDPVTGIIAATSAGTYGFPTGSTSRATFAAYSAPVISNPPTQAEVQAIANALQTIMQRVAALITDLKNNGNLS